MQVDRLPPTLLGSLPEGEAGTRETLKLMVGLVRTFKKPGSASWSTAHELTGHLASKDFTGEARALFEYVRDGIRYALDTHGVETVQTPDATLEIGSGDCDDKATLLAAMLEAMGHPTRFVALGPLPGKYVHVFVQTLIADRWVSLDATENVPMGWAPRAAGAVMIANN